MEEIINRKLNLQIILPDLLDAYLSDFDYSIQHQFDKLEDSELSKESFSFYTSVSAVFSSKIEGEEIELDSFIKHKKFGIQYQADYTRKTDDLYDAYGFAQQNTLNQQTLEIAHAQLTKHILPPLKQGKVRLGNMYVVTSDGKIEYVAASPELLSEEINKFYTDLDLLLNAELSFSEIFYFASMLHLVFVKIHPFEDGNGRISRLLEKWFLAEKLGFKSWFIQSERTYYNQHQQYYKNLRRLGMEYNQLDYTKSLPFLKMLAYSLADKSPTE